MSSRRSQQKYTNSLSPNSPTSSMRSSLESKTKSAVQNVEHKVLDKVHDLEHVFGEKMEEMKEFLRKKLHDVVEDFLEKAEEYILEKEHELMAKAKEVVKEKLNEFIHKKEDQLVDKVFDAIENKVDSAVHSLASKSKSVVMNAEERLGSKSSLINRSKSVSERAKNITLDQAINNAQQRWYVRNEVVKRGKNSKFMDWFKENSELSNNFSDEELENLFEEMYIYLGNIVNQYPNDFEEFIFNPFNDKYYFDVGRDEWFNLRDFFEDYLKHAV